jgi:CSLREA domain-containing protein
MSFSVTPSVVYHVTNTADNAGAVCGADCSLRQAISASNNAPGAVVIPAGTYKLTIADADQVNNEYLNATGSLDVLRGMGIYGAGMHETIVDANNLGRALDLDPADSPSSRKSFAIGDLTITNGHAIPTLTHATGGGGLLLESGSDYFGLERVAATSNQSDVYDGRGIKLDSPGTIRDSLVSANVARSASGGGLSLGTPDGRSVEISGSTISGNSATGHGGGIDAFATLRISNSTFSGNHANRNGGGINLYGSGSSLHMASSTVVLNTAQDNPFHSGDGGGGLSLDGSDSNSIVDSIVAYNTTANPNDPRTA